MNAPAKISYYALLSELARRIESGWEPENESEFCELYLDLTDAWLRSEQQIPLFASDERN